MAKEDAISSEIESHLKKWQEIAKNIHKQMAPFRDAQEAIRKSAQPVLAAREALQKSLEPLIPQQANLQRLADTVRLAQGVIPDLSHLSKQIIDFQRKIEESISPAFLDLQRGFKELPSRTQEALLLLGQHGWYLDPDMSLPALWELKDALASGNVVEAESALSQYFEGRCDEIEKSISTKFPHRSAVISAAFSAHRRGEYLLSIPVLLAQTDGICKEIVNEYLFMKKDKKPSTAAYVATVAADSFMAALLSPLSHSLPIGLSEKERPPGFSALNRHLVLHGESLDYGTKENSLKSVSLVNYVAHVLTEDSP